MAKKFAVFESSDGEEYDGPVEYALYIEDMVKSMTINSGITVTVETGNCLLFKRELRIKGTLRVEGTGKVGIL